MGVCVQVIVRDESGWFGPSVLFQQQQKILRLDIEMNEAIP